MCDSEHPLHLRRRHPCTSTVCWQRTDRHGQVTTWRDLCGLLCVYCSLAPYWIATDNKYFNIGCLTEHLLLSQGNKYGFIEVANVSFKYDVVITRNWELGVAPFSGMMTWTSFIKIRKNFHLSPPKSLHSLRRRPVETPETDSVRDSIGSFFF